MVFIRYLSNESVEIVIPKRIKRNNLSILKALASTVKKDYSSPHFKFIDDPYLIPKNISEKRTYSLSKISGQEAAHYVNREFPSSFEYDPAEPSIKSFLPPMAPKSAENTLEGLQERIVMRKCLLAYESYLKCLDENIEIPNDILDDLLDLLCFFNSKDPPEEIFPEKLFFQHSMFDEKKQPYIIRKTWNSEGSAERIFKNMTNPSIKSICAIIQGRIKYGDMMKAYDEFIKAKENNLVFDDIGTYNELLKSITYVSFSAEEKLEKIKSILNWMKSDRLYPTVQTFNSMLGVLKTFRVGFVKEEMFKIINEMKKCHVEPNLSTWALVLKIVYHNKEVQNDILYQIVEILSTKELKITEPTDYDFFFFAMDCTFSIIKDLKLAYSINNLVDSSSYNLIGDGYRESLYYTNFFLILANYENLDNLMAFYNRLVPNTYDYTFKVMDSIFNLIEIQEGYKYLTKIYSDMVSIGHIKNTDLLNRFLFIMASHKHNEQLQSQFAKIVENILNIYEDDSTNIRLKKKLQLTGSQMGDMMIIFLNNNDFNSAWNILDHYLSKRNKIDKFPSQKSLSKLCEECFIQKNADKALILIKLMEDLGFNSSNNFLNRIQKELLLNEQQLMLKKSI